MLKTMVIMIHFLMMKTHLTFKVQFPTTEKQEGTSLIGVLHSGKCHQSDIKLQDNKSEMFLSVVKADSLHGLCLPLEPEAEMHSVEKNSVTHVVYVCICIFHVFSHHHFHFISVLCRNTCCAIY